MKIRLIGQRVDQLGFAAEIQKRFAEPLKEKVKEELATRAEDRVAGERFEALLVRANTHWVNPEKFLSLYESGKLTRDQFIAAVKVQRDAALNSMGRADLDEISTATPSTPALRVTQIKGAPLIELADAVAAIATAAAAAA